ncbi:MAG: heavy-metal-associated domain-containing protein [Clostridia bacterium]|jgi:copper chaperone|nr:heavy-metal-associated domain-containing protein [Clostridia bacterium]
MESVLLAVKGMSCAHCKGVVEQALKKVPGVLQADADVGAGTVAVHFDGEKVNLEALKEAIANAGYEAL